ncbi:TIGR02679 family protein [Nocardia sp. NPDC020380]|uniref:TIGR02679 family protein n=1 Tax=Nocardia sp. NPDC020380 TaxID=3364309 RepID=UPI00378BABB6
MPDHPSRRLSPGLEPLWRELHRRLSSGQTVSRVTVGPLGEEERTALAEFFGMQRLPGEFTTVAMSTLEPILFAATGSTVRTVIERLVGPIDDRASERRRSAAERKDLWDWLIGHEVVRAQPALAGWAEATKRSGLIAGSVERTRMELESALRVLRELPGSGTPLPVFADSVLCDPHGLDENRRVQRLVVRALSAIYGTDPPSDAAGLRMLWDRAGIADDELSSTVLAAGLQVGGDTVAGRILRVCADSGHAAVLTLQQLRAGRLDDVPAEVWVVENPSVLALAVTRFAGSCPPMVCTSGWPRSAAVVLLQQLAAAGAQLYYHGDFDGEGLRIAAHIVARVGALPWRMTTEDYLTAVGEDAPPVGRVTPVPWDPELSEQLRLSGKSVPEERVAAALLDELARQYAV